MAGGPISRAVPPLHLNEELWERECAGKDPYPSEAAARAVLAMIRKTGSARRACNLEAYKCHSCTEWHLGNN